MISHWFVPDDKSSIRPERISKNSLWHKVKFLHDEDITFNSGDVLVISFDQQIAHSVKKILYQFGSTPAQALDIIDCGTLIQGEPENIMPILEEISASGAVMLFIGMPLAFMRYQVDNIRMASIVRESNLDDDVHFRGAKPGTLFQYIGTQRHLVSETRLNVEGHIRLSDLREDLSLAEPCVRDSEALIFNCDSMSAAEAGYMSGMSGSGLTATEACQLFRYAGAAQILKSVGVYNYTPEKDGALFMVNAIAQMIWYFLEGTTLREDPEKNPLTEYHIQSKDHDHILLFFKSEFSGRWWIENKEGRKVPCSYQDYRKACEEEFSDRIIKSVLG